MFSYDWQSIHLESSDRLSINSRHGKAIPKGDDKWEKGANICIVLAQAKIWLQELMRVVRLIASKS